MLAGGFGNCDKDNAEAETAYRRTIELEQASYKKNLNNLRTLNHEIAVLEVSSWMRIVHKNQLNSFTFHIRLWMSSACRCRTSLKAGTLADNCATAQTQIFRVLMKYSRLSSFQCWLFACSGSLCDEVDTWSNCYYTVSVVKNVLSVLFEFSSYLACYPISIGHSQE